MNEVGMRIVEKAFRLGEDGLEWPWLGHVIFPEFELSWCLEMTFERRYRMSLEDDLKFRVRTIRTLSEQRNIVTRKSDAARLRRAPSAARS